MSDQAVSVIAAMTNAGLTALDARGLMPLEQARSLVHSRDTFVKGDWVDPKHPGVLDSDVLWAALLSLADADEFLAQARRLAWRFHVRGFDNTALYDRYGEAVLGWVAERIDEEGTLRNVPWCLWPCVMASPTREAYGIAHRVRAIDEQAEPRGKGGPRQDVDETWALVQWINAHPEPGLGWLAAEAEQDEHAAEVVRNLASADPYGFRRELRDLAGDDVAEQLFRRLSLLSIPQSEVAEVLDVADALEIPLGATVSMRDMDGHFSDFNAPMWDNANYFCAGWRVMGLVHPTGDALVFQSLVTGLGEANARIELHVFGPLWGKAPWARSVELLPESALSTWEGNDLVMHTTGVTMRADGVKELPEGGARTTFRVALPSRVFDMSVEIDVPVEIDDDLRQHYGPTEAVLIRLANAHADDVFLDLDELIEHLGLHVRPHLLFSFDDWDHPPAGEPASSSLDLLAMTEALAERRAIETLPRATPYHNYLVERADLGLGWGEDGWPS